MEDARVQRRSLAPHGWIGLALIAIFWWINWNFAGARTHWAFFPLWLGYCLTVDALVLLRKGASLLTRDGRKYIGLFFISAPAWWLFELVNGRLQNWVYVGAELFTPLQFFLLATLSFSTVIPAVFGTAEFIATLPWFQRPHRGPVIRRDLRTTLPFFGTGWVMMTLMLVWPRIFFPLVWISVYFILEPLNIWLGNRSLVDWLERGDWRPVLALWTGVLTTAFFWEMWNYFSYPKWVYHVPWVAGPHLFEMPALGYGGYLPFALELFAIYHLITGFLGSSREPYVEIIPE